MCSTFFKNERIRCDTNRREREKTYDRIEGLSDSIVFELEVRKLTVRENLKETMDDASIRHLLTPL